MTDMSTRPGVATEDGTSRLAELRGAVGTPATKVVRAEDVRRFLLATSPGPRPPGEAPQVNDGDAAPPTFFCPDPLVAAEEMGLARPRPYVRNIDGGSEWEIRVPVHVGDVLTLVPRIADVLERMTSDGRRMLTTVVEILAWDADGTLVGVARGNALSYEENQ